MTTGLKTGAGLLTLALALFGTMATASTTPAPRRIILADASRELPVYPSPYAKFLVGRFAMSQGDVTTASQALDAASHGDPQNTDLREKAFLINILSGNIEAASALAPTLKPDNGTTTAMSALVTATTAIKANRGAVALKSIDGLLKVNAHDRIGILLRPYVLAMNGQWKAALSDSGDTALAANDRDRLLAYLLKAERARISELHGDPAAADALYKTLYQPGAATFIFGPDYAAFLDRQGRRDEAKAIWQAITTQTGDLVAADKLKRVDAPGYTPDPLPTLQQSMSQALFSVATVAFSEHDTEYALATLRLSLYLDNTSDRERIFLGQVQTELKDPIAADAAWASVPVTSPFYNEATLRRVWALRSRDELDKAYDLINQALTATPDALGLTVEKADILRARNDDAAGLAVLNDRIKRAGDADFTWQAWFLQAMLYDGMDQWGNAEAAIKKAQTLNGTQPEILNFLGYGWIDRNLHVEDGMDLVRKALAVNPKSGAMMDSLGWGYFRLGQYEQALSFIEQAVQTQPSDPEINNHLGDVYKAMGRDTEARYEWQRVLSLKITDKEAAEILKKLDGTPGVAPAQALNEVKVGAKAKSGS